MNSNFQAALRVNRTKIQAKNSYDRMSRYYDFFAGGFEQNYRNLALDRLNIARGETVLELGQRRQHRGWVLAKTRRRLTPTGFGSTWTLRRAAPGLTSGRITTPT